VANVTSENVSRDIEPHESKLTRVTDIEFHQITSKARAQANVRGSDHGYPRW
jgi:hypothetical protein